MALEKSLRGRGGILAAAVLLVVAGVYSFKHFRGYHPPGNAYFVDEDTGEEFVRPLTDIPPLVGKGGKESIVREYKYSDDGGKTAKVAYYLKYTAGAKKALEEAVAAGKSISGVDTSNGQLVRSPAKGSKWVSGGSDEGQEITRINIPAGHDVSVVFP